MFATTHLVRLLKPTVALHNGSKSRGRFTVSASSPPKGNPKTPEKFTTGGGGFKGFCDYEEIKDAIKECEGLEGERLEACYASFGCDVNQVTDHYAKAAGIKAAKDDPLAKLSKRSETLLGPDCRNDAPDCEVNVPW